jgi:3'(2'), 5'-bisphosphate nucleotidase
MFERELITAMEAVTAAAGLCEAVRSSFSVDEAVTKDDRSPVTVADFGAQALIIGMLRQAFPGDPVVGEEDAGLLRGDAGALLRERVLHVVRQSAPAMTVGDMLAAIDAGGAAGGPSGRFWTLDPIDGTKGFIRGDQYAVALALLESGRPVLGVLGCPHLTLTSDPSAHGWLYYAVRGGGAWRRPIAGGTPEPVRVRTGTSLAEAVFCESFERKHTAQGRSARIVDRLGVQASPLRMDSQCKYAMVAGGDADVYMRLPTRADYEEKIWDHAAGSLIVEEAGGRVSDTAGTALDFAQGRTLRANKGVLASSGRVHADVLGAIQAVMAEGGSGRDI